MAGVDEEALDAWRSFLSAHAHAHVTRAIDRDLAARYVRREPDPDDRRALRVTLTEEGIERHFVPALGRSAARVREMLDRMSEPARG
jgi:DNA-binding MarR family transcriptional regulator